ncbi:CinA family protein [Neptuniibacter sp.]|uniref:CinA family protein n=1 Tax=Neptuniibacter sp. TaxID=1962643 RepID=UPI003B5AEBCA
MTRADTGMHQLVINIADALLQKQYFLATAESCTGGLIARELTSLAGSSNWFDCGFVAYSNAAKSNMLGVNPISVSDNGAVSLQVVAEMAEGALANSQASISVATSGIAGPGGGSEDKPLGTVCFAWAEKGKNTRTEKKCFDGDRESVRKQAVKYALQGILQNLSD